MTDPNGLPKCCSEEMLFLAKSNKYWCQECDQQIEIEFYEPTDFEITTHKGRQICEEAELRSGYMGTCSLQQHCQQMRDPDCWVHASKSRWHQAYVDATGFYMQCTRDTVGNCISWWREGRNGYTCQVNEAHVFLQEEAESIVKEDPIKNVAWPKAVVDANVIKHCRMEPLRRWREEQGR